MYLYKCLFLFSVTCTVRHTCLPETSIKGCKFRHNCLEDGSCADSYCNLEINCQKGNAIRIKTVLYGISDIWLGSLDCRFVCNSSLEHNSAYNNEIANLCNGNQKCDLEKWHAENWTINVTYECQATKIPQTSPTFPRSTDEHTSYTWQTSTDIKMTPNILTDVVTTPNPLSDKFSTTALVAIITSGILLLVIVLVVMVCIKRKRRKENIQDTNITNEATRHRDHEPAYVPEYEYASAHIATNTTNDKVYNTLNESSQPPKTDPNYDHIVKQSSVVNKKINKTKENVYNSLNENTNYSNTNDDANYDHVSNPLPLMDETYSQVKSGDSAGRVTDMYSQLNQ